MSVNEEKIKNVKLNRKLVCCKDFPDDFLNSSVLRSYFSEFGVVKSIEICLEKMECIIEYITEIEGIRAVTDAGIYDGKKFYVDFAHSEFSENDNASKFHQPEKKLLKILKMRGKTIKDKYEILNTRDQLIRLIIVDCNVDMSKLPGCCSDMCPEKERLKRQIDNDVSQFELSSDHYDLEGKPLAFGNLIVKAYSLEKDPLPYEIRPEPVLKMTMVYLIHNIVDLGNDPDTSLYEWYIFLCDRFHAIRQEIKQQKLYTLDSIQIVEQCVRFYIHCSGHFICESSDVFDKKVNCDYLMECLKELNFMYEVFYEKENVISCRQTEFIAYMILLNLHKPIYEWQLTGPPEIIQAVSVKKAKAFRTAFQNKNYKKFFHLFHLRKTPYLSACILLGYFYEMRMCGIQDMLKNDCNLTIDDVTDDLSFETDIETEEFLIANGFTDAFEDLMAKCANLSDTPTEVSMSRQYVNLERKLRVPVSICIRGGDLTSGFDLDYKPQSSFDEAGFLKLSKVEKTDHLPFYEAILAEKIASFKMPTNILNLRLNTKTDEAKDAAKLSKSDKKRILRLMVLKKWEMKLKKDEVVNQYEELFEECDKSN